ncbi:MAG: hypothetical protein EBW53_07320, partial [Actinobacteria bacterium]|nr:hypothetical protein [Actinomycetota bacterium]
LPAGQVRRAVVGDGEDVEPAHEPTRRSEPEATDWLTFELPYEPQRLAQSEFAGETVLADAETVVAKC